MSRTNLQKLILKATNQLPVEKCFLNDLEMTMERCSETRTPSQTYKPSSLNCMRNMYYQKIGEVPVRSFSAQLTGMGESGTARHDTIQKWVSKMRKAGFDCDWIDVADYIKEKKPAGTIVVSQQGMETKCFNEIYGLSFLCDGIIRYRGEYYILEIKTETSHKYQTRTDAADDHKTQASCYSLCLGINKVLFLYENRDTCDKKPFIVHVTDEMRMDRVVHKIETTDEYVRQRQAPPKSTNKSDCKYCNYAAACRREG